VRPLQRGLARGDDLGAGADIEISSSRSMLQPAIRTTMTAARKLRIANHQMCQMSEKPRTVAKKAVMYVILGLVMLLRGNRPSLWCVGNLTL
jgi:hypothetical protein